MQQHRKRVGEGEAGTQTVQVGADCVVGAAERRGLGE